MKFKQAWFAAGMAVGTFLFVMSGERFTWAGFFLWVSGCTLGALDKADR